jgi:hypothetical protein
MENKNMYISMDYIKNNSRDYQCVIPASPIEILFKNIEGQKEQYKKMITFPIYLFKDEKGDRYCFSDNTFNNIMRDQHVIKTLKDSTRLEFITDITEKYCSVLDYHSAKLENIKMSSFENEMKIIYDAYNINYYDSYNINTFTYRIYRFSHNVLNNNYFTIVDVADMLCIFYMNKIVSENEGKTLKDTIEGRKNFKYGCMTEINNRKPNVTIDEFHEYSIAVRIRLNYIFEKVKDYLPLENDVRNMLETIVLIKDGFKDEHYYYIKLIYKFINVIQDENFYYLKFDELKNYIDKQDKKRKKEKKKEEKLQEEELERKRKEEEKLQEELEIKRKIEEEERMKKQQVEEERRLKELEEKIKRKELEKENMKIREEKEKVKEDYLNYCITSYKERNNFLSNVIYETKPLLINTPFINGDLNDEKFQQNLEIPPSENLKHFLFLIDVNNRLQYRLDKILKNYTKRIDLNKNNIEQEQILNEKSILNYLSKKLDDENIYRKLNEYREKMIRNIQLYKDYIYFSDFLVEDFKISPNEFNYTNTVSIYKSDYFEPHIQNLQYLRKNPKDKSLTKKEILIDIEKNFVEMFVRLSYRYFYLENEKREAKIIEELKYVDVTDYKFLKNEETHLLVLETSIIKDQLLSPYIFSKDLLKVSFVNEDLITEFVDRLKYLYKDVSELQKEDIFPNINNICDYIYYTVTGKEYESKWKICNSLMKATYEKYYKHFYVHYYHEVSNEIKGKLKSDIEDKIKNAKSEGELTKLFQLYLPLIFMEYFYKKNSKEYLNYTLSKYSTKILDIYKSYLQKYYVLKI